MERGENHSNSGKSYEEVQEVFQKSREDLMKLPFVDRGVGITLQDEKGQHNFIISLRGSRSLSPEELSNLPATLGNGVKVVYEVVQRNSIARPAYPSNGE